MSAHDASNEGANVESSEGAIFRSLQQIMDRLARLEENRPPVPPELHPREPLAHTRPNRGPEPESLSDGESDVGPRPRPRERVVEEITDREEYPRRRAPRTREREVREVIERRYPPRRRGHRPRLRISDEESEYDDPPLRPLRPRGRFHEEGSDASELPRPREHPRPRVRPPRWADVVEEEEEHPEAYLDWERRMDNIFECYSYSDRKKVQYAAAQLAECALTWWDREVNERRRAHIEPIRTWREMKVLMRKRYVPPHFHRELQRKYRRISQGAKTVEEFFEEFEHLRSRLELDEDEEAVMAQFLDGLNERIARKVERHPYRDLHELLHLAVQIEKQNQRKQTRLSKLKNPPSLSSPIAKTPAITRKEPSENRSNRDYREKGKCNTPILE
ncbi:PREDICTED: uncharacterized protein LOC109117272 [Tarenaya hassleriana]|uniref:uncharacterized protein LOC109117272 n=1 Tax=Tarenaya hassleriana TaxID=28532 RepID=UPI0008FD1EE9|nr:PREDICTED: uncharacterized protein LOC109117272 [Tarenaya hassleriana]